MGCVDKIDTRERWGPTTWGAAFAAYKPFSPQVKTLTEAEFIFAEHLNHRRGSDALRAAELKTKCTT